MCAVCVAQHSYSSVSSYTVAWYIQQCCLCCCRFISKDPVSAIAVFWINLCITFLCLYISFIISSFVGGSETTCKAFSFLFHYFLLVSCAAVTLLAFFTAVTLPLEGNKRKLAYLGAIIANWSMCIHLCMIVSCVDRLCFSMQYFPSS